MTLKDHYALCFKTHASFGAHHKNLNEDKPILPMTLDSGNIRFMLIIPGGSLDLCKFSLDLRMPVVSIYTGMVCHSRYQDLVVRLHLRR